VTEPFVILSFVVYRITRFIVDDSLIDAQRGWFLKKVMRGRSPELKYDPPTPAWRLKLHDLFSCPFCMSVWVGALTVLAVTLAGMNVPMPIVEWLAVCGGAMVVYKFVED
jgi:hypothetical protein